MSIITRNISIFKRPSRFWGVIVIAVAWAFTGGCGYHIGSIMHPQVKSIAIAPVKNETLEPLTAAYIRQSLAEQFVVDGSMKLKSIETADCILYGRITEVTNTGTGEDSYNNEFIYRPAQWSIRVKFEYVVLIPGKRKPLVPKRQVAGAASYDVTADQNIARRYGLRQACRNVALKVVQYTTEAW